MPPIDSFYTRTLAIEHAYPGLIGREEGDCIIIGAGLAGLSGALHLARAGKRVIVLESESVGWGASGRNGGFVSAGYACDGAAIARQVGTQAAQDLHHLSIEGAEMVRREIAALAMPGVDPVAGKLRLRRYDSAADLHREAEAMARLYEYPLTYLDRAAIRARLDTDRYHHGLLDHRAFHIHPLNYARGLAAEITRLGGRIYEASAATGHQLSDATKTITTAQGQAQAPHVIFATGGYTGPLLGRLRRAMLPIATYVMLSEEAPDLLASAIRTDAAISDNRRAGDYYRLVDGGRRLLWGGRITTRAAQPQGIVRELRHEMLTVYPQLAGLKTELAWSGLMAYARHLMPQIGALSSGVWHATAFGGHGLNTTAIGGRVVAEAVLGETDRIRHFAPFRLVWAGGSVGLLAAQMTYWKLQAQDWWSER
ncbi:MAG: FAD-binding oxidoreductase [Pararhodobacter sp.]|nr:FAD-binding oxidoreductase [Pararhodobacter sp.]